MNTSDLWLSSTTAEGEGIADFVQLVAATAMGMPPVNQLVPKSYVNLGAELQLFGRQLLDAQKPPVCTRLDVFEVIKATSSLCRCFADLGVISRALEFLADGGAVVLAPDGMTVILDPGWLADTLAAVITANPSQLSELPPALVQRGILRHGTAHMDALAAVWPDREGFSDPLRRTLLGLLHRFDLAFEVLDGVGGDVLYSIVPCMLPRDHTLGSTPLDDTIGPLVSGQSEVGVEYHMKLVPPDMWPSLIVRFRAITIPETCTRTSAVLQWGSQRGLFSLDETRGSLTLVCRGLAPMELRVRFHWALVEFVGSRYPLMDMDKWVHAVCHVCHGSRQLFGRPVKEFFEGKPLYCNDITHGDEILPVEDLVVRPVDALDKVLSTHLLSKEGVSQWCSLAARVVDTTTDMCDRHGHRAQLWLPVLASEPTGVAFAAGAGSAAAEGTSKVCTVGAVGGRRLGWVAVCEDPSGWHVACDPMFPTVHLARVALQPLLPILQRVAAAVLAVAGVTRSQAPPEWRDWEADMVPCLQLAAGDGQVNWVTFSRSLGRSTASRGRCGCWTCPDHGDSMKVSGSDVSLSHWSHTNSPSPSLLVSCLSPLTCISLTIVFLCSHATSTGTLQRTSPS